MAHSSSIDYVDNTILQARTLLAELTNEMQERIKRWKQIEIYCGFEIVHNPGSLSLERKLYGNQSVTSNSMISNNATTIKTSNSSNSLSKMLRRGSEATLSEEDSLSLISGTSPSTYSSYNNPNLQAVQAIQMWQKHQIPSNLNLKRVLLKMFVSDVDFHHFLFNDRCQQHQCTQLPRVLQQPITILSMD